jgi:GNAT superfamily N-acetyltransferase
MQNRERTPEVRVIGAAATIPLRLAVLRPGKPIDSAKFDGDELASTTHFGAFAHGKLLGVASLFEASMVEKPKIPALQLRGMATAPESRGLGLGHELVQTCIAHARARGICLLWCNARLEALGFYEKQGFNIIGPKFEIPDVGPHYKMILELR